jgi:peroxiredoxin Q/BCP
MPISAGQLAPDFTLPTDTGELLTLSSLRGQWVVLYAYPKDDTYGCTTEACEFRDLFPKIKKGKAVILGISPDPVKSHAKFKAKYEFPFELLADVEKQACTLFDVIKEKSMYGKKYMGVERSTFLIDEKGVLRREWRKVKVAGHAAEVLAAVREA